MSRTPDEADARLWAVVTATVRPLPGRRAPRKPPVSPLQSAATAPPPPSSAKPARLKGPAPRTQAPRVHPIPLQSIEPGRLRRLDRGRDELTVRIDLHGRNQDGARAALTAFVLARFAEHHRAVLVITGKGALGDGVLRRRVPEWLAEPPLRALVAGTSKAHRRHGGEGALYVALKRNAR